MPVTAVNNVVLPTVNNVVLSITVNNVVLPTMLCCQQEKHDSACFS